MKITVIYLFIIIFTFSACSRPKINLSNNDQINYGDFKNQKQSNIAIEENSVQKEALEIKSFLFEEEKKLYNVNDPGIKTDNFNNTSRVAIQTINEVIQRAKNECAIEHNSIEVAHDPSDGFWRILFYTQNTPGGCQTVYLDEYGITVLIVYGE